MGQALRYHRCTMAGVKERYSIRLPDGTLRTVVAQSHRGAKKIAVIRFSLLKGDNLEVWPQSDVDDKKSMRV